MSDNTELEPTLPPGREMDAKVAGRLGLKVAWRKPDLMPSDWPEDWMHCFDYHGELAWDEVPRYSTEISAAWKLVELIHAKAYWTKLLMHYSPDQNYQFMIGDKGGDAAGWGWSPADYNVYGETAPHAICLAFLLLPEKEN